MTTSLALAGRLSLITLKKGRLFASRHAAYITAVVSRDEQHNRDCSSKISICQT